MRTVHENRGKPSLSSKLDEPGSDGAGLPSMTIAAPYVNTVMVCREVALVDRPPDSLEC